MTPYEVVYGKQPPLVTSYLLRMSKVQAVETLLQSRQRTLATRKANLVMAQNCEVASKSTPLKKVLRGGRSSLPLSATL